MIPFLLAILTAPAADLAAGDGGLVAVIPQPVSVTATAGVFALGSQMRIVSGGETCLTGGFLQHELAGRLGALPKIIDATNAATSTIVLNLDSSASLYAEAYRLVVTPKSVCVTAKDTAGLFYGCQTLLQLVDAQVAAHGQLANYQLPAVTIEDQPRFAWRGFMLDEARHFFGKATVFKLLDTMAYLKLNRFHWHLTDDRWRLEIKAYPKLTTVGAIGNMSNPDAPAAFYTQDDIREIVRYAAERHILIIPEIEMPGHARGATVAYPELAGGDDTDPNWKLFTYNPADPKVWKFLETVLSETAKLFPGPYIHIGGDEPSFGNKSWTNRAEIKQLMAREELSSVTGVDQWFMRRMSQYVLGLGKTPMGWQEIAVDGLSPAQVAPVWWHDNDVAWLSNKIAQGYPVVVCPHQPTYFDFLQSEGLRSGRDPGNGKPRYSTAAVYSFPDNLRNLVPNLDQAAGVQAAAWSEQIQSPERLWFQILPRLTALAESAWTPSANKDYADFCRRLPVFFAHLERRGMNYFNPLNPASTPEVLGPARMFQPEWGGWKTNLGLNLQKELSASDDMKHSSSRAVTNAASVQQSQKLK